jgi:hypothetical protein
VSQRLEDDDVVLEAIERRFRYLLTRLADNDDRAKSLRSSNWMNVLGKVGQHLKLHPFLRQGECHVWVARMAQIPRVSHQLNQHRQVRVDTLSNVDHHVDGSREQMFHQ